MLEELVHRNGLVTLEEESRIKVLASQQMKAFQINKLYSKAATNDYFDSRLITDYFLRLVDLSDHT